VGAGARGELVDVTPSCDDHGMATQLALRFEAPDDDWRLDDHTREAGRRGLREARRALAEVATRRAA
jgi:hypothetical protein